MLELTVYEYQDFQDAGPLVKDLELAEALGYQRLRDIRELIRRHGATLQKSGKLCSLLEPVEGPVQGNSAEVFYLNEEQALFICAKSDVEKAIEVTREVIHVFVRYRRGGVMLPAPVKAGLIEDLRSKAEAQQETLRKASMIRMEAVRREEVAKQELEATIAGIEAASKELEHLAFDMQAAIDGRPQFYRLKAMVDAHDPSSGVPPPPYPMLIPPKKTTH